MNFLRWLAVPLFGLVAAVLMWAVFFVLGVLADSTNGPNVETCLLFVEIATLVGLAVGAWFALRRRRTPRRT